MPTLLAETLIKNRCEINYLNILVHIFKVPQKEEFFTKFRNSITDNLAQNSQCDAICLKYRWLAEEFNAFIDTYVSDLAYMDQNFEPNEEYLENIKQLKISYEE